MAENKTKKLVNHKTCLDLKNAVGENAYLDLLNEFTDYCARDMEAMLTAVKKGDLKAVENIAHNLKSIALTYGMKPLAAMAKKAEAAARKSHMQEIERLAEEILPLWRESIAMLKADNEDK